MVKKAKDIGIIKFGANLKRIPFILPNISFPLLKARPDSLRSQSIDLHDKSINWFLNDGNSGR